MRRWSHMASCLAIGMTRSSTSSLPLLCPRPASPPAPSAVRLCSANAMSHSRLAPISGLYWLNTSQLLLQLFTESSALAPRPPLPKSELESRKARIAKSVPRAAEGTSGDGRGTLFSGLLLLLLDSPSLVIPTL
ncbi:hypothetical protein DFH06DRAFT_1180097, partial [Mycena polygramma]